MRIFLDESGDLGFDFENKSPSQYFVITLLVCTNRNTVTEFHTAVKRTLKRKVNHKKVKQKKYELKASLSLDSVKEYFYRQIKSNDDWYVYSVVLNKRRLLQRVKNFPEPKQLYNVLARKALENISFGNEIAQVELIVDKSKNNKEIQIFNEYLSNHLASKLSLDTMLIIDHVPSVKSTGLQSVDMFSWGIFRKYERNDLGWYQLYCHRIEAEEQI